jgi:hypothetical protein
MSLFCGLPSDIVTTIVTSDPQTWRAMRRVAAYYHQLLSWPAYVDKFTVVKDENCLRTWTLDWKLHREHDLPAVVALHLGKNRPLSRGWYKYGMLYRGNDKPTIISGSGDCRWRQGHANHRDGDRPATILEYGTRVWAKHNKVHRDNNKPAVIRNNGIHEWFVRGVRHRTDIGPSVVHPDGTRIWYHFGREHRFDNPAVIRSTGTREWHYHGERCRKGQQTLPMVTCQDGSLCWVNGCNVNGRPDIISSTGYNRLN